MLGRTAFSLWLVIGVWVLVGLGRAADELPLPGQLIAGIKAEEFGAAVLGAELRRIGVRIYGVDYRLLNDGQNFCSLQIGIFKTPAAAEAAYKDFAIVIPVPFFIYRQEEQLRILVYPREKPHAFHVLYKNVLLMLNFDLRMTSNPKVIEREKTVAAVIQSLQAGKNGVILAPQVTIPRVVAYKLRDGTVSEFQVEPESPGSAEVYVGPNLRPASPRLVFATDTCVLSEPIEISRSQLETEAVKADPPPAKPAFSAAEVRTLTRTAADRTQPDEVRHHAIIDLLNARSPEPVPELIRIMDEESDALLRQDAIRALGEIGDRRAIAPLRAILEQPVRGDVADEGETEAILRRHAVLILLKLDGAAQQPLFEALARSAHEYFSVREYAGMAVRKVREETATPGQ